MKLTKFIVVLAVIGAVLGSMGERASDQDERAVAVEPLDGPTVLADFDNPVPAPRLLGEDISRALGLAPWVDVCSSGGGAPGYCGDVGARAINCCGGLKGIEVGWIVGVAWRPAGSLISRPDQEPRVSDRDAFYYIVIEAEGSDYIFLRQAREITAI